MKIVFLCRYFWPHVGGVEGQVGELSKRLIKKGYQVTVITTKHDQALKKTETLEGIKIIRLTPLALKYFGLVSIWWQLVSQIQIFKQADIIHAHSVLIWYWPFKLLLPKKPTFVTWHGWEGVYPIPKKNILIRKIDSLIATKKIAIHDYLLKHYGVKADAVMYTAVDMPKSVNLKKNPRQLVYVGRLDQDTGLEKILQTLSYLRGYQVDFCGDGSLKDECRKYGQVHGWVDPKPYYETAAICLSPGVTSILEAMSYKCLVATTYNNPVKKDYLLLTPFKNWIVVKNSPQDLAKEIKRFANNPEAAESKIFAAYDWVKTQSWDSAVKLYERVWQQR
jgi:glycosyltransferase involved in cell wall biosynthesis